MVRAHLQVPDNQQKMTEKNWPNYSLTSPRELRGNLFFIVARMISVRLKKGLTDREGEQAWNSLPESGNDTVVPVGSSIG